MTAPDHVIKPPKTSCAEYGYNITCAGSTGGESIPNKQHEERTDGRTDKPRTLIKSIPTDSLADKSCDECSGDSERSRQYEAP